MKIESKIIQALQKQKPRLANITEKLLKPIQERTYHLCTAPPLFVKWISKDDVLGLNEVRVNQTLLQDQESITPRLIQIIELDDGVIGCWEWLAGSDLRNNYRNYLPQAFAQLGSFHKAHRHHQGVYSLITQQEYDTTRELLEAEHRLLCAYHEVEIVQKAKPFFSLLEIGFPTQVHGDLHPGNIKLHAGKLKFIDWSYSWRSLNLFDLSYVETIRFAEAEENEWWIITPEEADQVLSAYYEAAGMLVENIHQVHRAVMLWTKLWTYYNSVRFEDAISAERCKRQIAFIFEIEEG